MQPVSSSDGHQKEYSIKPQHGGKRKTCTHTACKTDNPRELRKCSICCPGILKQKKQDQQDTVAPPALHLVDETRPAAAAPGWAGKTAAAVVLPPWDLQQFFSSSKACRAK